MSTTTNIIEARGFTSVPEAQKAALENIPFNQRFRVASFQMEDRSEIHVVEVLQGSTIAYLKAASWKSSRPHR